MTAPAPRPAAVDLDAAVLSRRDCAILAMTPEDIEVFWSNVDKTPGHGPNGDCHIWTGGKDKFGYGWLSLHRVVVRAHRIAFFLENGHLPPPEAPCALHSCDHPPCVRNDHIWAGTVADNNADMKAKGRGAIGDRNGARKHPERMPRGDRNGARLHPERVPRGDRHSSRTCPGRLARGERHGCAKLTQEQVDTIRLRYASEGFVTSAVAKEYGVHKDTIRNIIRGKKWVPFVAAQSGGAS